MKPEEIKALAIEYGADYEHDIHAPELMLFTFSNAELADYTAVVEDKERERLINAAQGAKDVIAARYNYRIETGSSDMTSNSDWRCLEGATSVVEAIRSLK